MDLNREDFSDQMSFYQAKDAVSKLAKMIVIRSPADIPEHLQKYVWTPEGSSFTWFKHPLVHQFFPMMLPGPLEDVIRVRAAYYRDMLAQNRIASALGIVDRPWRMQYLIESERDGTFGDTPREAALYWQTAAWVWTDAELAEDHPDWTSLMSPQTIWEPERSIRFMTEPKDRRYLASLPDRVTVYKGIHVPEEVELKDRDTLEEIASTGWSWTLSRATAKFFARRLVADGNRGWVVEQEVDKSRIRAYLTSRNEAETLIPPGTYFGQSFTLA